MYMMCIDIPVQWKGHWDFYAHSPFCMNEFNSFLKGMKRTDFHTEAPILYTYSSLGKIRYIIVAHSLRLSTQV